MSPRYRATAKRVRWCVIMQSGLLCGIMLAVVFAGYHA